MIVFTKKDLAMASANAIAAFKLGSDDDIAIGTLSGQYMSVRRLKGELVSRRDWATLSVSAKDIEEIFGHVPGTVCGTCGESGDEFLEIEDMVLCKSCVSKAVALFHFFFLARHYANHLCR